MSGFRPRLRPRKATRPSSGTLPQIHPRHGRLHLGLRAADHRHLRQCLRSDEPQRRHRLFAPPDQISFFTTDGFTLWTVAYVITESAELDAVTYQSLMGPDMENPRPLALFAKGWKYKFCLIPTNPHFIGLSDGSPPHILGTDKLGRDTLSRSIVGSRISLMIALVSITLITVIGNLAGISSGYVGGLSWRPI
ncbi:hypothetical protein [Cypionkella sp. TWP1-2-1b2]|uniref:hypothetical protein n=1 Tax=Cypionkella sp. TWP1-2-1b2 TaxID=2804675 RepID=UPI003CF0C527